MEMDIFHTVNSGLYFRLDGHAVFFDGLHGGSAFGMSDTSAAVLRETEREDGWFSGSTALVYTHFHDDHYDEELTRRFVALHPDTLIYSPEYSLGAEAIQLEEGLFRLEHGPFTLYALATGHQGGKALQLPHFCYLLTGGDKSFLICGDARLTERTVDRIRALAGAGLTAAFVNVYHLNTERDRSLIRRLDAKSCCISHLPLPVEDANAYRRIAEEAAGLDPTGRTKVLSPMKLLMWL